MSATTIIAELPRDAADKGSQDRGAAGRWKYELQKAWLKTSRTFLGRRSLEWMQPGALCYLDAACYPALRGHVALTIDDPPCCRHDSSYSMMREIRQLLAEFDVKATFFCRTDYAPNHVADLQALMREGHQVCLQCPVWWLDPSMSLEDFEEALLKNQTLLDMLRASPGAAPKDSPREVRRGEESEGDSSRSTSTSGSTCSSSSTAASSHPRYLRIPSAKLSRCKSKAALLEKHNFQNVGADCDSFESITDSELLASHMLEQVASGSIAAFCMPERGGREETYLALRMFLEGLNKQGLKANSLSSMMEIRQKARQEEHAARRQREAKAAPEQSMDVETFLSEPSSSGGDPSPPMTAAATAPVPKRRQQRQRPRLSSASMSAADASSRSSTTLAVRQPWWLSWPCTTRASQNCTPPSTPSSPGSISSSPARSPVRSPSSIRLADYRVEFHKLCWRAVQSLGSRKALDGIFPGSLCYLDEARYPGVKGMVALTIDDAPCSRSDPCFSMVPEVKELLSLYGAQATFFLCTDYVQGHEEGMQELLAAGHEVANHCPADRSYASDSKEAFEAALLAAEEVCDRLRATFREREAAKAATEVDAAGATGISRGQGKEKDGGAAKADEEGIIPLDKEAPEVHATVPIAPNLLPPLEQNARDRSRPRWFRAPHGRMTPTMKEVLDRHSFQNVLTDCYANDPWISDANFIAATMLQKVDSGSVAVIHMPEHGFRGYNFRALKLFLDGLKVRGLKAVSLTTMHEAATEGGALSPL